MMRGWGWDWFFWAVGSIVVAFGLSFLLSPPWDLFAWPAAVIAVGWLVFRKKHHSPPPKPRWCDESDHL